MSNLVGHQNMKQSVANDTPTTIEQPFSLLNTLDGGSVDGDVFGMFHTNIVAEIL